MKFTTPTPAPSAKNGHAGRRIRFQHPAEAPFIGGAQVALAVVVRKRLWYTILESALMAQLNRYGDVDGEIGSPTIETHE